MSASTEGMKGPRLEFVVRPIKGMFSYPKHSVEKKKVVTKHVRKEAGYIVYMPNGTSYHLTHAQLLKGGFDRQPTIINFESVNDTKSLAGRYKFAMDDKTRKSAWQALEAQVIKACHRRHGPVNAGGDEDDNAGT